MEEILASIRRIISEDEEPAAPSALEVPPEAPEPERDDVLELTERAPEPEPAAPALESVGDLDIYPAAPEPTLARAPAPPPAAAAAFPGESLVSEPVAASTASVFGQLAHRVAMPKEGRTLEDVVREMLNPLLKAWLDEHLPAIVQAKVEEEVERIARRGVG